MKSFEVQSIPFAVPLQRAFSFIADPGTLPRWAEGFESVDGDTAVLRTPEGAATIRLAVDASAHHGTVDWRMTFPEGSVATAFSRLVALGPSDCVFSFVLTPPPVPLEALEGALAEQSQILARELKALKEILESDAG